MSGTDHLAKARDYIAKGDDYYQRAGSEIAAWLDEDAARTHQQAADRLGVDRKTVARLVKMVTEGARAPEWSSGSNKRDEVTASTLAKADESQVAQIVADLPPEAVERIVAKGTDRLVENARARRAEHSTRPTVKDLMGDDPFNPAEHWADTLIIRMNRNARELSGLVERAGGLLFGSMEADEAFEYLQDTERRIAEVRAAAQELLRDQVGA